MATTTVEATGMVTAIATGVVSLKHAVMAVTTVVATEMETETGIVTVVPVLKLVLAAPAVETIVVPVEATTTTVDLEEGTIAAVTDCSVPVFGEELCRSPVHLSCCRSVYLSK